MDFHQLKSVEQALRDIDDGLVEQLIQYLGSRGFGYSLEKIPATILYACERSLSELVKK